MTLYDAIKAAWSEAGDSLEKPPHLQAKEDAARKLDDRLAEFLKEPVQMWQDGLISASELFEKVCAAAGTEA